MTDAAGTEEPHAGADETGNLSTTPGGGSPPAPVGSSPRRPNPAASAASRARRIGGSTGTRQLPSPATEPVDEPVTSGRSRPWSRKIDTTPEATPRTSTAAPAAAEQGVALRKRQPRITSARDLKAEAGSASATVTEVPAWLRWVPAIVLSACAIAMIVIIAVSAHGVWYAKPSTASAREQVLAAAKKCTATANTYNYKTLAADEKRGLACTTGAWTAQYRSALEKIVKPTATQLKASQTVDINSAGVESVTAGGKQWTTIVYGQLTINQAGATPRIDQFAAIVRMDKVKSTYLVSKIDLVTNPNA